MGKKRYVIYWISGYILSISGISKEILREFCVFISQAAPPKAVKKATPAKAAPVKNGAAAKKAESEDDDDDSGKW